MSTEPSGGAEARTPPLNPDEANEAPTREYHGEGITVQWFARRCIHSGNCVRSLPRVFDHRRKPWIDATADSADDIERTVRACPSGALQYIRHHDVASPQQTTDRH